MSQGRRYEILIGDESLVVNYKQTRSVGNQLVNTFTDTAREIKYTRLVRSTNILRAVQILLFGREPNGESAVGQILSCSSAHALFESFGFGAAAEALCTRAPSFFRFSPESRLTT